MNFYFKLNFKNIQLIKDVDKINTLDCSGENISLWLQMKEIYVNLHRELIMTNASVRHF